MHRLLEKIDWNALKATVAKIPDWGIALPEEVTEDQKNDEKFLQNLHMLLVRRQIVDGEMQCPNCDRVYEIKNGIANMLLLEDEI
jgi:multifunctional methyltransferase subunit TRM112